MVERVATAGAGRCGLPGLPSMRPALTHLAAPGEVSDPARVGRGQADLANPYVRGGEGYDRWRPRYPDAVCEAVVALARGAGGVPARIADIGAGTGLMTRHLLSGGKVVAIEPATAMARRLRERLPSIEVREEPGEATSLPDGCLDLAVYAQSWHWLDPVRAGAEAARILRPGGAVAIVFNQLDVRVEWVKRLTRIMRSGDVHSPRKPPRLGPCFGEPRLRVHYWTQTLSPAGIAELGATRSSYLRASEPGRAHMRANLKWYLHEHLGLSESARVALPYMTLLWTAERRRASDGAAGRERAR